MTEKREIRIWPLPWRLRWGLGLLALTAFCGFGGYTQMRMARVTGETPSAMRCEDLVALGPGANHHLELSGCALDGRHVAERGKNDWMYVWMPARPVGADPDGAPTIVIKSGAADGPDDLPALFARESFTGVLLNDAQPLAGYEREMLEEAFPDLDTASVWIVHEGIRPYGYAVAAGLGGAGALSALALLWIVIGAFRPAGGVRGADLATESSSTGRRR